jgi:hypothetical protein
MTILLTIAVYSVRISSDIPIQSEYLPLISLYFFLSILFTFIAMLWFIILNRFATNKKMPKLLMVVTEIMMNIIKRKNKPAQVTPATEEKSDNIDEISFESKINSNQQNELTAGLTEKKCRQKFNCLSQALCSKCSQSEDYEKEKKNRNKYFESCLQIINNIFFCILFLIMFISNMAIWISMASNRKIK